MTALISKWGNSQGIRIPKKIFEQLNLSIGEKVSLRIENNKIIIEPIKKRKKYKIEDLVAKLPKEHEPYEEFSEQIGREEW